MYVEMRNIYKQYGNFRASDNVSFGIAKGKLAALLGPSGSGKTTLLRMIAGLENPNAGDIFIDGKRVNDIPAAKRGIGFVFQSYNLIGHQTVLSNVELALTLSGVSKSERRKRAMEVLEKVGLGDQIHKKPNQMSGGQQQRVAIARAMCNNPTILLADEPTGALDQKTGRQVMDLFHDLNEEGRTIIMITHDKHIAEHAKRIVRILDGNIGEGALEDA